MLPSKTILKAILKGSKIVTVLVLGLTIWKPLEENKIDCYLHNVHASCYSMHHIKITLSFCLIYNLVGFFSTCMMELMQ